MEEKALEIREEPEENIEQKQPEQPQEMVVNSGFDIASMLGSAGSLVLRDEQREILFAPPVDADIEIRPDGLIYAPWMEYQTRLIEAFGLSWCLLPEGNPKLQGNFIYWKFHLIIDGIYMTTAIGCQEYQPSNRSMNYGDAVEGARSNALMRCCKHLGITKELWKPAYIRAWKSQFAESYKDPKTGKKKWRKKGARTPEKAPDKPSKPRSPESQPDVQETGQTSKEEYFLRQNLLDEIPKLVDASSYPQEKFDKIDLDKYTTKKLEEFKSKIIELIPESLKGDVK